MPILSGAGFPWWGILLIVLGVVILLIIFWWISALNKFRRMQVKIDEAESGIDVALTKRFDLLTKAVAAVKGYAKHEKETLESVISMRQPAKDASMQEKAEFANAQTEAMKSLNLVVERYPELKADTQFSHLQVNIADVEEHLQASRRLYNSNVSAYNQAILVFPGSVIANHYHFEKREFFEAEEAKREDVKIEF